MVKLSGIRSPYRQMQELAMLLVILLLTSCATGAQIAPGDVLPAAQSTGLYVIEQAAKGTSTTFMMASKDGNGLWMFAKWIESAGAWTFTSLDMVAKDVIGKWKWCGGTNVAGCKDMADLVEALIQRGWEFRQPQDLPPGFAEAVTAASGWVRTLHTIPALLVPAGSFEITSDLVAPSAGEY